MNCAWKDKRGEEHVALATEYGKTQLNQGHITDKQDKPRGSGFELHTDEHGVIRVAKGLFVTADGQTKGAGEVLDMATTLREIEIAIKQIEQLKLVQEQVDALIVDINVQREMFSERLQPMNELIHFSAPEGVAFTSGEHLQMAAAENIHLNAGGDISAGAMGNVNLMAGEKVGLFAHKDKLSLIANEGPIKVEAQNAAMKITAAKKLSMSAEQDILFAGKKRIVLIGGGSYLKLEAGRIEYGTEAKYARKTMRTHKAVAREMEVNIPAMQSALPALSCGEHSACFKVTDTHTGAEDIEFAWALTTESGQIKGQTNEAKTSHIRSDREEFLMLDYVFQIKAGTK
jgi:type VI secretion system secreted protein VgrG